MPTYTSVADVYRVCPFIGSVTTINSATVAAFIGDVEALMNAKLSKRYTVPLSGATLLSMIATDLAAARIMTRRMFTQEQPNKSDWPAKYEEAMTLLQEIVDGKLDVVTTSGTVIEGGSDEVWGNTSGYAPTFAEDGFESSVIDQDKLDAIDRL